MIEIALVISLIFCSIGFIITSSNAKYILSGYNTMSEADRAKIDIDAYLRSFKRFHIVLGFSLFIGVWLLSQVNNNWASLFMTIYPLVAYIYFLILAGKSFNSVSTEQRLTSYVVGSILVLVIGFITYQGLTDYKSSTLILSKEALEINGTYGIKLKKQDIYKLELVNELPPISYKSNGFAAGDYAKGSFKVKGGSTVKLFVNKKVSPFLLLRTFVGDVYYNTDESDMYALNKKIRKWRES